MFLVPGSLYLSSMQGVHEVQPETIGTLYTDGMELPYVEYGQMEPALKLLYDGEELVLPDAPAQGLRRCPTPLH